MTPRDPLTELLSLSIKAQTSPSSKEVQVAKMKAGKLRKKLFKRDYKND